MTKDYLQKILTARVYDVTVESPLELTPTLSQRIENQIYFKREGVQSVFSPELRGTYNKMASLRLTQLKRGVICASAGNHAQGLALSAAKLSCHAVIVMPTTTPQEKVDAVRARGGEVGVVLFGDFYTDAYNPALTLEKIEADIRASVRRSARDRQSGHHRHGNPAPVRPDPIHEILVPIGGDGLIAGDAAYVKVVRQEIKIIDVQTTNSNVMASSLATGCRVTLPDVGLFTDGTAVKLMSEESFHLARLYVDEVILVDTNAVCIAIRDVFQDTRSILEPSDALAVAGAKAYVEHAKGTRKAIKNQTLVTTACASLQEWPISANYSKPYSSSPWHARPGARRTTVSLRVPGASGRADALPQFDGAELEISACSIIAARAAMSAASWSVCKYRKRK